jgi:hypothetical protein
MSDNSVVVLHKPKGHIIEEGNYQEPLRMNSRLKWLAHLVCAILNAENPGPSSIMTQRTPDT